MRNELEEIERIEKYLSKELSPSELLAFEEELKNNTSLQEKVFTQKIIVQGIRKKAFKEVATISFKKFKLIKKLWWGGIGLAVVAATVSVLVLNNNEEKIAEPKINPIVIPTIDSITIDTPSVTPMTDSVYIAKPKLKTKNVEKRDSVTGTSINKTAVLELEDEKVNEMILK